MSVRAFSYGGGVQSTAALVLAAQGEIDYPLFLFANVGDDDENPATLDYVRSYAVPYAEAEGIELVELRRVMRDGSTRTLSEQIDSSERSIPIPIRMENGAPGNRSCTGDFKIRVIARELKRRGATADDPAAIGIGISLDEFARAQTPYDERLPYQLREHPLLDMRISRDRCRTIIAEAGLPVPPKSSCFYCPFKRDEEWRRMARLEPELFEKACALEDRLHARGKKLDRGDLYFTRHGQPLRTLFDGNETVLFDEPEDVCESGFCMT